MKVEELVSTIAFRIAGLRDLAKAEKALENIKKRIAELNKAMQRGIGSGAARDAQNLAKQLQAVGAAARRARADFAAAGRGRSWVQDEIARLRQLQRLQASVGGGGGRAGGRAGGRRGRLPYGPYGSPVPHLHQGDTRRAGRWSAVQSATGARETFRQKSAGMTPDEIAALRKQALDLSTKYPSVSMTEIRDLGRSLRNLTGDSGKGMDLLADVVRARVAIQSASGGNGDGDLDSLLKSADIAGLQDDPGRFRAFLDSFVKATQVEGRQISARDYLAFYRRAKSAGSGFNDDFIAAAAPSLMQELGGPTAGTALMTYYQQLAGGRAKKSTLAAQKAAGLRGDDGVLVDRQDFIRDPFSWTQKHIGGLLRAKGIDTNDNAAMLDFLIPLFSDRNAGEIASKFLLQGDQIKRNQGLYKGASGLAAAESARKEDPFVAVSALTGSLSNLVSVATESHVKAASDTLNGLADAISGFTKRLSEDPNTASLVGTAGIGAAGAGAWWSISRYKNIIGALLGRGASGTSSSLVAGAGKQAGGGLLARLLGGSAASVLTPLLALREAGEVKKPMTPTRHRMDQVIDPSTWEKARRAAEEFRRDPEGVRGRAMMNLRSGSWVEQITSAARNAKTEVNAPISMTATFNGIFDEAAARKVQTMIDASIKEAANRLNGTGVNKYVHYVKASNAATAGSSAP